MRVITRTNSPHRPKRVLRNVVIDRPIAPTRSRTDAFCPAALVFPPPSPPPPSPPPSYTLPMSHNENDLSTRAGKKMGSQICEVEGTFVRIHDQFDAPAVSEDVESERPGSEKTFERIVTFWLVDHHAECTRSRHVREIALEYLRKRRDHARRGGATRL